MTLSKLRAKKEVNLKKNVRGDGIVWKHAVKRHVPMYSPANSTYLQGTSRYTFSGKTVKRTSCTCGGINRSFVSNCR